MIPVRLNVRNFMCYTDVHEPLVFDGIEVACLSGQNGHGKSALLDAMTWALWGKSRARSDDELVHLAPGCSEMEVEFEFRLGAEQYRVLRKRNKRGRGQSILELGVKEADNGSYRALTGNNLRETERQIEQLLRMSYDTFTNSSFMLQGKADSFTTRTPGDRKQILAEILDLSYYDRLEERARRKERERLEQQAVLRQQIQDDDAELQRQPSLREQQERLAAELASLDEQLGLSEARYEVLRERLNRLTAGERELREQERRLQEARARADRQRALLATAEAALARAGAVIEREAEIEQGHAELLERRAELERLAATQAEHGRLSQDAARLERGIAQARGQLEGSLKQLRGQLGGIGTDAARLEQFQAELEAAQAERQALDKLDEERVALEARIADERERYATLKARHGQHEARLAELTQHREMLGTTPTCPICRTVLGADRHRNVLAQYRKEEERLADLARKDDGDMRAVRKIGTSLKDELDQLKQQLARRPSNQERLTQAERALARAQEQTRRLDELRTEVARVEADLAAARYAVQEQQDLVLLQRQIGGLGYDATQHKAAQTAVAERAQYEALRQDLLEARRSLAREQQAKDEAARGLAEWDAEADAAERRRAELLAETGDLPTVQAGAAAAETELRRQRLEQGRLHQELGAVRQHLSTMEFTAQRRAERLAELDRVMREVAIYQQLVLAFGKKGLQAMLIETAIPEIQDEANRLLGLMTDGRMHVSFETQRDTKSGDTVETLDINIRDELGVRAYELYSGGEAFRVNFAIRIALSKLLARRAGARLQTLVIDEGFGSQDEQGRDRLVEAIRVIQHEFEKILIITHLTELKDLFPTRIEITKTPAGSVIEVN